MRGLKRKKTGTEIAVTKITWENIKKQKVLIFLSIPFVIYTFIFSYVPLFGWCVAFLRYRPVDGFLGSAFIGLEKFKFLFVDNKEFWLVLRNTVCMGIINLALGFLFAIFFALLLNEVRLKRAKKFAQTVSYLPHFLSWIIVCGILQEALSIDNGIINDVLLRLNLVDSPINFFAKPELFWWITGFANVWKETGWNSIIYLAAITAINPDLYEAADIDGAGRLQKIWHITLPGIKSTIFILLIMNIGGILNAGFEIQYLLSNPMVQDVSQTVDIYVLKYGISLNDFSLGTAAGIFKSLVSITLIVISNRIAKAAGEERLF